MKSRQNNSGKERRHRVGGVAQRPITGVREKMVPKCALDFAVGEEMALENCAPSRGAYNCVQGPTPGRGFGRANKKKKNPAEKKGRKVTTLWAPCQGKEKGV